MCTGPIHELLIQRDSTPQDNEPECFEEGWVDFSEPILTPAEFLDQQGCTLFKKRKQDLISILQKLPDEEIDVAWSPSAQTFAVIALESGLV